MKRILSFVVAFIVVLSLASCSDCDTGNDEKENVSMFQVMSDEVINFDSIAKEPQKIYVAASSDVGWKAEVEAGSQEWLKITTETDKIIVEVNENTTNDNRQGKITITPDNDAFKSVEITVLQNHLSITKIDITKALLIFYGDMNNTGFSYYQLIMGDGDAIYIDEENYSAIEVSNGHFITFELYAKDITPKDYQIIELPEGTYKSSMDLDDENFVVESMTFLKTLVMLTSSSTGYFGSYMTTFEEGKMVDRVVITDGEIKAKNDNGQYSIDFDLLLADDSKTVMNYSGGFDGKFDFGSFSTYDGDTTYSGLNEGRLDFNGDDMYNPDIYFWNLTLEGVSSGSSDELRIIMELYSPMTSTTVLPDGEYNIITEYEYTPYTSASGFQSYGYMLGAWAMEFTEDAITDCTPLVSGTINVTHNGGDNYTIDINAVMDNYYLFKCTFVGELQYADYSMAPPREMPSARIAVPATVVVDKTIR